MYIESSDPKIEKIQQAILLNQDMLVSSIIWGQRYIGKTSLIKKLYKSATWVDGSNLKEVHKALLESSKVVITNFEKITNTDSLNFENVHVMAIYNGKHFNKKLENKFAFIYHFPSLKERKDDIEEFTKYYIEHIKELLDAPEDITVDKDEIDLSNNLKSLKKSIYKAIILKTLDRDDIYKALYNYFVKSDLENNIYDRELKIFDKALIDAGIKRFKSQLQIAKRFGISRNTLRKKIDELEEY